MGLLQLRSPPDLKASPYVIAMDRRQGGSATGASGRRLDTLRQKRSALRARGDEVRGWAGGGGAGSSAQPARALSGRDAAALAAASQRRRTCAYAVSSSSSSSEAEEEGGAGGSPAPTAAEATAKLFAKLGIKGGSGHDSDTSWASSPERGRIRALHGGGSGGAASSPEEGGAGSSQLAAELARAQATITALQQELAAARAQADSATVALHDAAQRAAEAEHQLALRYQQQQYAASALPPAQHTEEAAQLAELAAQNEQLLVQLEEAGGQLAAAAAWQAEVRAVQEQLAAMQAAVAESEAARQQQEEETAELLRQRDGEIMEATARLAAAEAQLAALAGCGGVPGVDGSGSQGTAQHLRPTAQLLAQFAVTNAQLTAALGEAAALLSAA